MGFKKVKSKNVFLSMILCSVASFLLLYADNLKECQSKEDKKSECVEEYLRNGLFLEVETPYKNGVIHGVVKSYYFGTNLEYETPYKNGKKEGVEKWYHNNENGNLRMEKPYKNDKAEGIAKYYDENGNLEAEIPYKNDKAEGIKKEYYPSGDLRAEIPYTNDKVNGVVKFYDEEKKLVWQATAQNGKLISGKCSNGKTLTYEHLTKVTDGINYYVPKDFDYRYNICKQ